MPKSKKAAEIHYRPAGRVPRCHRYQKLTREQQLAIFGTGSQVTTDIERVTCDSCLHYVGAVVKQRLEIA